MRLPQGLCNYPLSKEGTSWDDYYVPGGEESPHVFAVMDAPQHVPHTTGRYIRGFIGGWRDDTLPKLLNGHTFDLRMILVDLLRKINGDLVSRAASDGSQYLATCAVALFYRGTLGMASVGDAVVAVHRKGSLFLWSDTGIGESGHFVTATSTIADRGRRRDPNFLGNDELVVTPENCCIWTLDPGDVVLLFTDGLEKTIAYNELCGLVDETVPDVHRPAVIAKRIGKVLEDRVRKDDIVLIAAESDESYVSPQAAVDSWIEQKQVDIDKSLVKSGQAYQEAIHQIEVKLSTSLAEQQQRHAQQIREIGIEWVDKIREQLRAGQAEFTSLLSSKIEDNHTRVDEHINAVRATMKEELDSWRRTLMEAEGRLATVLDNLTSRDPDRFLERLDRVRDLLKDVTKSSTTIDALHRIEETLVKIEQSRRNLHQLLLYAKYVDDCEKETAREQRAASGRRNDKQSGVRWYRRIPSTARKYVEDNFIMIIILVIVALIATTALFWYYSLPDSLHIIDRLNDTH